MARKSTKGPKPVTVKELPPRVWTNRDGSQGIAYPLRYTNPETGKVLRPQYRTKADRTRKRIQIESELLKGVHVPLRDRPTLAEFAWHYYDERKGDGLTRASLESIENRLRLHILGGGRDTKPGQYLYLGDCVMAELKQFEIREWANDIEGKIPPLHLRRKREYRPEKRPYTPPRSRRLVIAAKELLTEMFAAAVNDERTGVHRNVAALVKIKDAAAKRKSQLVHAGTDFMTPEEAEMLLRYFRRQATTQTGWYWYVTIASHLYTGMRNGELRALLWNRDIDFDEGWIYVRRGLDRRNVEGPLKNAASERNVRLLDRLADIYREWKTRCAPKEGNNWRVDQLFKAQQDASVISDQAIEAALGGVVSRWFIERRRRALGLPKFRRNMKSSHPVVVPLALKQADCLGHVIASRTGTATRYCTVLNMFIRVQRELGLIKRDAKGEPIIAPDGDPRHKYGMHAFRHFFVSYMAHEGFTMEEVGQMVGHTEITMTFHYRHIFRDAERERQSRAKMAAAFDKLEEGHFGKSARSLRT